MTHIYLTNGAIILAAMKYGPTPHSRTLRNVAITLLNLTDRLAFKASFISHDANEAFELNEFEYFIHQHRYSTVKTVKSRTVSTGQKGSKSTYNCPKRYVIEDCSAVI